MRTALLAICLLLPCAVLAQSSRTFTNGCMDGKTFDAGLCYEHCKDGYNGVGPVCWAACPDGYHDDGATCRKTIDISKRDSYGRGVGSVLTCASGQEMDAGLCYPGCKSGYHGVGPVCWEVCGKGTHDFGAFCGIHPKKSYGRGAGKAVSSCSAGHDKDGALCYPACKAGYHGVGPVCWQDCPAGTTAVGATCNKGGQVVAKKSYGRGAGTIPPLCHSTSFTRTAAPGGPDSFTLLFVSDTQLPWWRTGGDPNCNSDACVLQKGKQTNGEQVSAMNAITSLTLPNGKKPTAPEGLILNGDLTAYWHDWQEDLFETYYNNKKQSGVQWAVYPGLGNHDYSNNNNETGGKDQGCWWTRDADKDLLLGNFGCANNATNWARAVVNCNKVPQFPAAKVQGFDNDSMAYSWNIGKWHFVQLHNHPTFKVDKIGVKSSIVWLKADLAAATKAGFKIVLNMHDYYTDANDAGFKDALTGARVVAVFAGHLHDRWGRVDSGQAGANDKQYAVYMDGASEYQTFLVAEFAEDHLSVTTVSSAGGKPSLAGKDTYNHPQAETISLK